MASLPDALPADFMADAQFAREGDDLMLQKGDELVLVRDYFTNEAFVIETEAGTFSSELVSSFLSTATDGGTDITGAVSNIEGQAYVIRNGARIELGQDSILYKGDIIETTEGGAIELSFIDDSKITLGGDARLAIDNSNSDANAQTGQAISILKGSFSFSAGKTAEGDASVMVVQTPGAEIDIRGTKIVGEINPGGESTVTALEGSVFVSNKGGTVELSEGFATARVTSAVALPENLGTISSEEAVQRYVEIFEGGDELAQFVNAGLAIAIAAEGADAETVVQGPIEVEDTPAEISATETAPGRLETALETLNSEIASTEITPEIAPISVVEVTPPPAVTVARDIERAPAQEELLAGDDYLTGDESDNTLDGMGGDDFIIGAGGHDTLIGGTGADTLIGDAGNDILQGGGQGDTLYGNEGEDTLTGGAGRDSFWFSANTIDETDTITDLALGEVIIMQDVAPGVMLSDFAFDGDTGTFSYNGQTFAVAPNFIGMELQFNFLNNENIASLTIASATELPARFFDGTAEDGLFYDPNGGGTVTYTDSTSRVLVDLVDQSGNLGDAQPDTYDGLSDVIGSNHDDTIRGDDNANRIEGGNGVNYLYGRGGNDIITGGSGNDEIWGGAGADTLDGGGSGNDRFNFDTSTIGAIDTITSLVPGGGALVMEGWAHDADWTNDFAFDGDTGTFSFRGTDFAIAQNLIGQDITYSVGYTVAEDELVLHLLSTTNSPISTNIGPLMAYTGDEAGTVSYVWGISGVVADFSDPSNNQGLAAGHQYENIAHMIGTVYGDELTGDGQDNRLEGGAGADILMGGAGADTLIGGTGTDTLTGGAGADRFVFAAADLLGPDTIIDLEAGDMIEYSGAVGGSESSFHLDNGEFYFDANGDTVFSANEVFANLRGLSNVDYSVSDDGADTFTLTITGTPETFDGTAEDGLFEDSTGEGTVTYADSSSGVTVDLVDQVKNYGDADLDTYSGVRNVIGSDSNDDISGDDNANRLEAGEGFNSLDGRGGDDLLIGGSGTDYIYGGAGTDRIDGGGGLDLFYFDTSTIAELDTITSFEGTDCIVMQNVMADADWRDDFAVDKATGTISFRGTDFALVQNLINKEFAYSISYDSTDNELAIIREDDYRGVIDASSVFGNLIIYTGAGGTVSYENAWEDEDSTVGVTADLSTPLNNARDAAGHEYENIFNLIGSVYDDSLTGDGNDNRLEGGAGTDTLAGGAGVDTLTGGEGADIFDFSTTSIAEIDSITDLEIGDSIRLANAVGASASQFDIRDGVVYFDANKDTIFSADEAFANLQGVSDADYSVSDDGGGTFTLTITATPQTFDGAAQDGLFEESLGGGTVTYTDSYDAVTVDLADQSQNLGDAGSDSYSGIANIIGSENNDNLYGDDNANRIEGIDGFNHMYGRGGDDVLIGSSETDYIYGGAGADRFEGGGGNDNFYFDVATIAEIDTIASFEEMHSIIMETVVADSDWRDDFAYDAGTGTLSFRGTDFVTFENMVGEDFVYTLDYNSVEGELELVREYEHDGDGSSQALRDVTGFMAYTGEGGTVNYETAGGGLVVDFADTSNNQGAAAGDGYGNIANVIGSSHDDGLTGDGNDNRLEGRAGADTLTGGEGGDTFVFSTASIAEIDTISDLEIGDSIELSGADGATASQFDVRNGQVYYDADNSNTFEAGEAFASLQGLSDAGYSISDDGAGTFTLAITAVS